MAILSGCRINPGIPTVPFFWSLGLTANLLRRIIRSSCLLKRPTEIWQLWIPKGWKVRPSLPTEQGTFKVLLDDTTYMSTVQCATSCFMQFHDWQNHLILPGTELATADHWQVDWSLTPKLVGVLSLLPRHSAQGILCYEVYYDECGYEVCYF